MSEIASKRALHRGGLLLLLLSTLVYGLNALRVYEPYTFAKYDSGWLVIAVQSIVADGDIDLKNQLNADLREASDQTSRGQRGEWYPVHEPLLPLLAVPFYHLAGINGCLLLNLLLSCGLVLTCYYLGATFVSPLSAFCAASLVGFVGIFLNYSYEFSADVFGCLLIILAVLAVARKRYGLAGVVFGLSVCARLSNVALLPALFLYVLLATRQIQPVVRFLAGGLPLALLWGAGNWWMYGSPFDVSYDHWVQATAGGYVVSSQRSFWELPQLSFFLELLLDKDWGLLRSWPLLPLALLVGLPVLLKRHKAVGVFVLLSAISLLLFFGSIPDVTIRSGSGNRYFMSLIALCAVPLAVLIEEVARGGRER